MRPALMALTAVSAIVVTAGSGISAAAATPAQDLARARDAFRRGDCESAIPVLSYLLYPTPRLAQTSDLVEAHVLFGVCAFETGDRKTASREFEEALFLQSDLALDGNALFSKEAVAFFQDTRTAVIERGRRDADRRALAEERERLRRYRESLIVYEVRPYYVNFIPFGAGQFQNSQRRKGIAFATAQAVTGALSAGLWMYQVAQYGFGGVVPAEDSVQVRRLQEIEIGAGIACLGLVAWGIVDSLVHYRPRVQVEGDDTLLPKDLRRPAKPEAGRTTPSSSLRFAPTPLSGGAGLSMSWTF